MKWEDEDHFGPWGLKTWLLFSLPLVAVLVFWAVAAIFFPGQ